MQLPRWEGAELSPLGPASRRQPCSQPCMLPQCSSLKLPSTNCHPSSCRQLLLKQAGAAPLPPCLSANIDEGAVPPAPARPPLLLPAPWLPLHPPRRRWCCGDMDHFDISVWAFEKLADVKWGVIAL